MSKLLLIYFLFIPLRLFSQDVMLEEQNLDKYEAGEVILTPRAEEEKVEMKDDDVFISNFDEERGIFLDDHRISDDDSKFSFAYHFNLDLQDLANISSFEFIYTKKSEGFFWYEFAITKTAATFNEITTNNFNATQIADDTVSIADTEILSLGAGLSARSQYLQDLFDSNRIFETWGAQVVYHQMNLDVIKFSGLGLRSDFAVHYRKSPSVQYGAKLSYNLAPLKRAQEVELENSSDRSLTLSWFSVGLELGFFF